MWNSEKFLEHSCVVEVTQKCGFKETIGVLDATRLSLVSYVKSCTRIYRDRALRRICVVFGAEQGAGWFAVLCDSRLLIRLMLMNWRVWNLLWNFFVNVDGLRRCVHLRHRLCGGNCRELSSNEKKWENRWVNWCAMVGSTQRYKVVNL